MPRTIKVLIVDDSIVIRSILKDAIAAESRLEVVGLASDGVDAIQQARHFRPDVVVLDMMLPLKNGSEVLESLRGSGTEARVIVFSSLFATKKCHAMGMQVSLADDVIMKPSARGGLDHVLDKVTTQLIPRIVALGSLPPRLHGVKGPKAFFRPMGHEGGIESTDQQKLGHGSRAARVIAVGASTGGPDAVVKLLNFLPEDFAPPIVIAQHMPTGLAEPLAQRLSHRTNRDVRLASHGAILKQGCIRLIADSVYTRIRNADSQLRLELSKNDPTFTNGNAIDRMFESLAVALGDESHSVVLTGMGKDGLAGARLLREKGATVDVQDQESCAVWGMPRAVFEARLANRCTSLHGLARRIATRSGIRLGVPRVSLTPSKH